MGKLLVTQQAESATMPARLLLLREGKDPMKVFVHVLATALTLVASLCSPILGDTGDEILKQRLDRCDLAIVVEMLRDPQGTISEKGVVDWQCNAKILQVMKGDLNTGKITFSATRFESEAGDECPELRKGKKCILFLIGDRYDQKLAKWETADPWLGVMRHSPTMAKDLARIAKE